MTQSRLLSTNGYASYRNYFCQINFSGASYTTVITTNCKDLSYNNYYAYYGTGIKYDPIAGLLHSIEHISNLSVLSISWNYYVKVDLVTGA